MTFFASSKFFYKKNFNSEFQLGIRENSENPKRVINNFSVSLFLLYYTTS